MKDLLCVGALVLLSAQGAPVRAERILFQLSGVVSEINDQTGRLPSTIFPGAPVSGELYYDTASVDEFPVDPQRGRYQFPHGGDAGGIAINVGGHTFRARTDNEFYVEVDDDLPYLPFDDPGAVLPATDYFWIPGIEVTNSVNVEHTSLQLFWRDPSTDAFDSDSLPRSLVMTEFVAPTIDITGCGCVETGNGESRSFRIRTTIHSAIAVPEPSAASVISALGLLWLLVVGGRYIFRRRHCLWRLAPTRGPRISASIQLARFECMEARHALSVTSLDPAISVFGGGFASEGSAEFSAVASLGRTTADKATNAYWRVVDALDEIEASPLVSGNPLDVSQAFNSRFQGRAFLDTTLRIQTYMFVASASETVLDKFRQFDVHTQLIDGAAHLVQALVPRGSIERLLALPEVVRIDLPAYVELDTGSQNTVGDEIHRADDVRSTFANYGINGTGVRVGVISGGIEHRALIAGESNPNLPPTITVNPSLPGDPTNDEGTAMLEIVHDIAPGAELLFSGFPADGSGITTAQFRSGIQWMMDNNVDVIVDDLEPYSEPFFQDGIGTVAQRVQEAISAGITYVSSAGNAARRHYQGLFTSSGGGFPLRHDFNPGPTVDSFLRVRLAPSANVDVHLQWSDAWGASGNDYNLVLWNDAETAILASSTDVQNGNDNSYERILNIQNTSAQDQHFNVSVVRTTSAAIRELEIYVSQGGTTEIVDDEATPGDSIHGHKAVQGVIAVGAVEPTGDATTLYANGARGPSRIVTDFVNQTFEDRPSLDGMAVHSVATRVGDLGHFSNPFRGTSAAAPHVAGNCGADSV